MLLIYCTTQKSATHDVNHLVSQGAVAHTSDRIGPVVCRAVLTHEDPLLYSESA